MPDKPLSPEHYAYAGGVRCPSCLGRALTRGRYDSEPPDTVTRRWGCADCCAAWAAVYELTGYEGLTTHTEAPGPTTPERTAAFAAWLAQMVARFRAGACWHCAAPLTAKRQVGPYIYAEPCGCRLGQGRLRDASGTPVPRLVVEAAYIYGGGRRCPVCLGTDLARGRFDSAHPDTVTRRWGCADCGASWAAVYELTGYEGLTRPPQDAPLDGAPGQAPGLTRGQARR